MNDKRGLYAVIIVAVILLLLLARRNGGTTVVNNEGDEIVLDSPNIHYNLPPIAPPRGSPYDWMQTTDLGCGCDVGLWKEPVVIQVIGNTVTQYPSYVNIVQNIYSPSEPYDGHFDVYTPPPLPTWRFVELYDVYGKLRTVIEVSDEPTHYLRYLGNKQTFKEWTARVETYTLTNGSLYANGKRYVHGPGDYAGGPKNTKPARLPGTMTGG